MVKSEDNGLPPRLHPADLAAITDALRRGMSPSSPSVDSPPTIANGADAALFRKIMREEIERNKQAIIAPDAITVRDIVREELEKIFADLDMAIDPEHIHDTRRKFSRLFDWLDKSDALKGSFVSAFAKALALWAAGIVTAGLTYFGIKGNH